MKSDFLFIFLLCLGAAGCSRPAHPVDNKDKLNPGELSISQADSRLSDKTVVAAVQASVVEAVEKTATKSPDAKSIQTALKNLHLYEGKIDGKMGSKTRRAIKEFQASNGLAKDGKVGPKTWELLSKAVDL